MFFLVKLQALILLFPHLGGKLTFADQLEVLASGGHAHSPREALFTHS